MKLSPPPACARLAGSAAPAAAQYDRAPTPVDPQSHSQPRRPGSVQGAEGKLHPSGEAAKSDGRAAEAVNANDTANIPAKLAAAQAVATTKEDRYIDRSVSVEGGAAANDDAGDRRGDRCDRRFRLLEAGNVSAKSTSSLGSSFTMRRNYDGAAAAFEHAATLDPPNIAGARHARARPVLAGPQAEAVGRFQRDPS